MSANSAQSTGSCVLLLSLRKNDYFDKKYDGLLSELRARAYVAEATHVARATRFLPTTKPSGVLVTDPAITDKDYAGLMNRLLAYVHEGGTVVFCCDFGNGDSKEINRLFQGKLNLCWATVGEKTDEVVRRLCGLRDLNAPDLASYYEVSAMFLVKVDEEDIVYESGETLCKPFPERQVSSANTKVGEGWMGRLCR